MATKTRTSIWSSQTLTADAADTTSSSVDLSTGLGATLNVRITNGATGPTIAATVQIEVSNDDSSWYDFKGPMLGSTGNAAVSEWGGIVIPSGVKYLRLVGGGNTDEDVTVDADISEVAA